MSADRARRLAGGAGLACALALLLTACGPTPADLQAWLRLDEGPARVAAVIVDGTRSPTLRQAAVMSLLQEGAVKELAGALRRCPPDDRLQVTEPLWPALRDGLAGTDGAQRRAKEAILYLGGFAAPATQDELRQQLLQWAFDDFLARYRTPPTPLPQLLPQLGSQVAVPLLRQLRTGVGVQEAAETLQLLELPEVNRATALVLVEQARARGRELPLPLVNAILKLDHPELTPLLLEIARDPQARADLRAAFLDHVLDCRGPAAAPGLAQLLTDRDLRWTAARHLLTLEGLAGLQRLLRSLPEGGPYPAENDKLFEEVDLFCEQELVAFKESDGLEATLLEGVQQAPWPGKLVALHCLGTYGSSEALPELERAASLGQRVTGWKGGEVSLGSVAKDALTRIKQR